MHYVIALASQIGPGHTHRHNRYITPLTDRLMVFMHKA